MRKVVLALSVAGALLFTGCGSAGIGSNIGTSSIKQTFEIGKVVDQKKVLVDKGHLSAIGSGAALGAGAGAILGSRASGQHALQGGLIGAVVGAGAGLAASMMAGGNEVEAFQIDIESGNKVYTTYVEYDLPIGTMVEFIVRPDGTITNIDVKRAGKKVNSNINF